MQISKDQQDQFITAAKKVAQYDLVKCSSGNLSWRLDEPIAAVTASRSWLGELTADQIAVCDINTGKCLNDKIPTVEHAFHLGILRNRPEINVVLHFQSPFATTVACGEKIDYNFNVIIEVPCYIGTPAVVDYFPPGSVELADATINAMENSEMAILRNHGLVTVGKTFNDAIQKAVFFELACQIILTQPHCKTLTQEQVQHLR
ncbi:MAG: class II aldolase/adducin family protein, partial [Phycisphaerae bacterium]|nr:class II aldolase/adducin family protein [Phycisphaerae bacterium]